MPTGDLEDEANFKKNMGLDDKPKSKGRYDDIIEKHALRTGLDPDYMRRVMKIESGGDAGNRTGSYKGLYQLSEKEFKAHGGTGNIYDPEQNTMAAANMFAKQQLAFKERYNRDMKPIDRYMIHQQGAAGYSAHLANPDEPAWKNVRQYYGSDEVAKKAIWGNIPDKDKASYGSVDNVTSRNFTNDIWAKRLETESPEYGGAAIAGNKAGSYGGYRGRAREESDDKMSFLEGEAKPKQKGLGLFEEDIPLINPQYGNLVPRFSIG